MLSHEHQLELKEHLDRAQNPIFYYDNDADGLCSFLLFRRYLGRGNGVAVRSYPELHTSYAKKAEELKADYVFILDKPVLSNEFVAALSALGLPIVWVDHHFPVNNAFDSTTFFSYNSAAGLEGDSVGEPVTYIAQCICRRSQDIWIAMMGCIADHYLPDFTSDFAKEYPDFWGKSIKKPFDAYYTTEIGKLARALNFGLKDSITHVVQLQNYLSSCSGPEDVMAENPDNRAFRKKYQELTNQYTALLHYAESSRDEMMLFFEYGGVTSMSADIANELSYRYPQIYIAVAYTNGGISNVSLRGKQVKSILLRIIPQLFNASGGGHTDAVGARIRHDEIPLFRELLLHAIQEMSHERRA